MRLLLHIVLALVVMAFGQLPFVAEARAQLPDSTMVSASSPTGPGAAWTLVVDGEAVSWPLERQPPVDSLRATARTVLAAIQAEGHYLAEIDSATVNTIPSPPAATLYATRGPEVEIGEVVIEGASVLDAATLRQLMNTRAGRPLDPQRLENDLDAILQRYEDAGYPLASVRIDDMALIRGIDAAPPRLRIVLQVDEGRSLVLQRIEVPGEARTDPGYVARVTGLRPGQRLVDYDPDAIRQRLEATGFYRGVEPPELLIEADTAAVLRIPVVEEAPGAFDLVLGYLPSRTQGLGSGGGGGLVGNGHLTLRNLFGSGRMLSLKLNRLPGRVSSVNVRAADPYLLGLPLRVEGRFEGIQQDSTFGQQRYGLEVGYRFAEGFEAYGTLSRELTKPGQAGVQLVGGRQRIPRSEVLFYGLGLRYERLDRRINPRRGLYAETNLERGNKERVALEVQEDGVPAEEVRVLDQERLTADLRLFLPTFRRQVGVLGGEAHVLLSNEYDTSDLFRFGGATSLRGYNEEQFLGNAVARVFTEYRYQLDRASYAFLFIDLGYVERPEVEGQPSTRAFHPGYGVGAQLGTDLGLMTISLASNPDDPAGVRAHLGLSIGL
jgi:outer membrane protein assembly factor BamA